jgi:hypothetical protein
MLAHKFALLSALLYLILSEAPLLVRRGAARTRYEGGDSSCLVSNRTTMWCSGLLQFFQVIRSAGLRAADVLVC